MSGKRRQRFALALVLAVSLAACRREAPPPTLSVRAVTVARGENIPPSPLPTATPITPDESSAERCDPAEVAERLAAVAPYEPNETPFITLQGAELMREDRLFVVRGVNYYPSEYPFWRFLQVDAATLAADFDLLAATGLNTLRIFIWSEALFTCPANGAVPVAAQFERLDAVIQAAAERGLYLIVTLNEQPDITSPPLYEDPAAVIARAAYVVQRYKDEPAILAWDLRDGGDADYAGGTIGGIPREAHYDRRTVLDWLIRAAAAVRAIDSRHLITAGWNQDAAATAAAVDLVSFQYWDTPDNLIDFITAIRQETAKPLLLIGVGYDSLTRNESVQSSTLREALRIVERGVEYADLVGWVVWTAFDFAPGSACDLTPCPGGPEDARHYFGLWHTDRSRKPAVNVVEVLSQPLPTPVPTEEISPTETPSE